MTSFEELLDEAAGIDGVRQVMIVDGGSGRILHSRNRTGGAGSPNSDDLRRQLDLITSTEVGELVQDVVLSSGPDHILLRTVPGQGDRTMVLRVTLDRAQGNLATTRFRLRSITRTSAV